MRLKLPVPVQEERALSLPTGSQVQPSNISSSSMEVYCICFELVIPCEKFGTLFW